MSKLSKKEKEDVRRRLANRFGAGMTGAYGSRDTENVSKEKKVPGGKVSPDARSKRYRDEVRSPSGTKDNLNQRRTVLEALSATGDIRDAEYKKRKKKLGAERP